MTPALRVKFGLIAIVSVVGIAFAWSAAQGQFRPPGFRPPLVNPPAFRPPGLNPPGLNPPGMPGGGMTTVKVWTCTGCGQELGRGLSAPPNQCPHCGARIINGVGNGIPQPGMQGMNPPPMNPGFNPPAMNPPIMNPPAFNPGGVDMNPPLPVMNPTPQFNPPPAANNSPAPTSSNANAGNTSGSTPPKKGVIVALVIGVIVVGIAVLVGGTFLVIYTMRNNGSSKPSRRRLREDDYDD